jgi:Flp pilus assembly protein TadD
LSKFLLRSTIETHPCFGAAHNALGCVLAREESYQEALKSFTAAVEEEPENATFIKNLALACERLGMTKKAVECYTHLAGCDPASIPYARRRILSIQETLNTPKTP